MPSRPIVSVVTPVYNGAAFLRDCIESVLGQSFRDWEYLIHDNRSSDDSYRIAEHYTRRDSRIRLFQASQFCGIWRNHNLALGQIHSDSRYCKIVHADDWLDAHCLERMLAVAEAHPSAGLVSSYRLVGKHLDGDGLFEPGQNLMDGRQVLARAFLEDVIVTGSPSTLLIRAEIVRRSANFFDEDFWHSDTDAANRVLLDWDCGFAHQVLSYTRLHSAAQTSRSDRINTWIANEGRQLIRYGRLTLSKAQYRRLARRFVGRYAWFLGKQVLRPWRYADTDYHKFHYHEIERMGIESGADPSLRASLAILRLLVRHISD